MSAVPEDFDRDATSDEGIWREAAERLRIATAAESENRINGLAALDFLWGNQWDDDIRDTRKNDGRPALTINHTAVQVNRLKNTLRQQRPRIKCHPVGDGADVDTAMVVNGLIRHIEALSDASVAYDNGVGSAIDIGWGYWRIVSEYLYERGDRKAGVNDQELLIKAIANTFTVYMDPAAKHPAGLDQDWCIISETMKRSEYKRKYPKAANVDWRYVDAPGDMTLDWESKEEIRLAEYFRVREHKDVLCQMNDGSVRLKSELPSPEVMIAANYRIAKGQDGKDITRPTNRVAIEWFRLNGKTIVDRKVLPGKYIPVIRCEGQVSAINGRVKRKGMIYDIMDPARIFNYTETMKTERYALAPKAPWVGAEGQFDGHPEWNDANQKSYSTLIYKPTLDPTGTALLPPPQRTPPAPVEAGMAEWSSSAERNLMAVAGMAPENPDIQARVVSGNKYLQRRQGMQDLVHFQYYDNQTLSIAATGVILLDLLPYYYDTKRMQRIIGDDGVPQVVPINTPQPSPENPAIQTVKNDLQVGRYDVVMDTGPGYATKREEATEAMVNLLGTPLGEVVVKTGADIVLRNMDFPGADELADRAMVTNPEAMQKAMENLPKQAQTIIGALQAQLQQKDQVIQQQGLELKYKATIESAKVEERREKTDKDNQTKLRIAGIDTQKALAIEDSKATTARDVAEIHGAAQLLNSHMESREEEKEADKLIRAGTQDSRPSA